MPSGMKKGKTGAATGGRLEKAPAGLKRERNKRKNVAAHWKRLNGPVTVRRENENSDDSR
ncbi:MAG: hypothetical protein FIB00_14965 [Chloroflexi bacterium]|nr:hypothetical protein [Chloroflexota bacterium]PWB45578.1 MAG: hypothetical protein C3F10_05695 [Dehalococcoidia bacterium]